MSDSEPLELEASADFAPSSDTRPKVPEPLPVRLIAVRDVCLPAQRGLAKEMTRFYVDLLGFDREPQSESWVYRADNVSVRFVPWEGLIERDVYRPLQVEVLSLAETEKKLVEAELQYTRQRGLVPGQESLALLDPSGNWVEITESRRVI